MKAHTNNFKNEIKLHGREIDSKITYTLNNEEIELGNEELNSITPHYEGNILKSVMKQLDIDSNVDIPVGTEINFQFGLKVENEYEYLNYGNYIVYSSEKKEDTNSYNIIAYDKMLKSMVDYFNVGITYPITIRNYINAIATYMGLAFKNINESFSNYDKVINGELYLSWNEEGQKWESLNYTFRDVLDELAQVTASTICINNEDQLEIRYITPTNDTVDEEYLKDVNVNFEEKYGPVNSIVLSRSAQSDNVYLRDEESVSQNGLCEIKIVDNQIMNWNDRSDYLPDILSKLGGLEYQLNDFSSTGIMYYDLCDRYSVKVGNKYYSCIMFNDDAYITQGLYENIHTNRPEQSETDYSKADKTDRKINQTYLIVDKQNQKIESVISNVTQQDQKISQITQTVDDLTSKISDVADLTISGESSYAEVQLDNINESEPIMIKVHPTSNSIRYLYPRDTLYPSDTLYPQDRIIRFHNRTTNENIDYKLPMDLLYYDSEHYDEFYLDYESQTCQITRWCSLSADGTVTLFNEPQIQGIVYPYIPLDDGNYTISLLGYNYGYIFVRLMSQNLYTTQFYTKAETNSIIEQTATSIDLGVNQKLSNYSTTQEMNSAIVLKANEITSSVSETYSTKSETQQEVTQLSSRITQNAESITSEVTRAQNSETSLSSRITQNANSITSEITRAQGSENALSSRIAQSVNSIDLSVSDNGTSAGINIKLKNEDGQQIESDSANITLSGLVKFTDLSHSGSTTINGNNITTGTISASRLSSSVITTSNLSAQTITGNQITGGTIQGSSFKVTGSNSITVYGSDGYKDAELNKNGLLVYDNSGYNSGKVVSSTFNYGGNTYVGVSMIAPNNNNAITVSSAMAHIKGDLYVTGSISHGSLKELKKNIKIYNESVLQKIIDTDIYSFNYKAEKKGTKKHYGFIIGDGYKTPDEVVFKDGVDLYAMCSMLWKGMQEQQKQIEELKNEMEELKNAKN